MLPYKQCKCTYSITLIEVMLGTMAMCWACTKGLVKHMLVTNTARPLVLCDTLHTHRQMHVQSRHCLQSEAELP